MDCYHLGTEGYGDFIRSLLTTEIGRWIHQERLVLKGDASAAPRVHTGVPYVVFFQPKRRGLHSSDSHWQPIRALPRHVKRHMRLGLARLVIDECGESGQVADLSVLDELLGRESIGTRHSVIYLCQNRLIPNTFRNLNVFPFDFYVLDALTRTNQLLAQLPSNDPLAQEHSVASGKRFLLSLNATPRFPRLLMCSYLEHVGLLDDALVSLPDLDYAKRTYSSHEEWLTHLDLTSLSFLRPAAERLISRLPLVVDETPEQGNELVGVIPLEAYRMSAISVVTETATHTGNRRITEKTSKVLGLGHPFVVYSHPQSVDVARDFGFSAYDDLIDHGYDQIEDEAERLLAIGRELERLRHHLTSDSSEFWTLAREQALYNRTWASQKFFPKYAEENLAPVLEFLTYEEIFDRRVTNVPSSLGARDEVQVHPLMYLRPKPSPFPLIRIGSHRDGSHMVPEDLNGIQACFPTGAGSATDFEDDLAMRFGIRSHLCDCSIDVEACQSPLTAGLQTFRKERLDVDQAPNSVSLSEWVHQEEGDGAGDLLLQMDIEGAEFRILREVRNEILLRFRIIVVKIHGLHPRNEDLVSMLDRLEPHFTCIHARADNSRGEFTPSPSLMNLPQILEVTLLRNDRFSTTDARVPVSLPHVDEIDLTVEHRPPLFLNEWWQDTPRSMESELKIARAQLAYLKRQLANEQRELATTKRFATFMQGSNVGRIGESVGCSLRCDDVAQGKPYGLTSSYGDTAVAGFVRAASPYFFHTDAGPEQAITVDLQDDTMVCAVVLHNRTDTCFERAKHILVILHGHPRRIVGTAFVPDTSEMARPEPVPLFINFEPLMARCISVINLSESPLHLSAIRIIRHS
jgi:hypothetical protein